MAEQNERIVKAVKRDDGSVALYNSRILADYLKEHPHTYDIKDESQTAFSQEIRNELHIGVEFPDEDAFKDFYKNKINELKEAAEFLEKAIGEQVNID